MVKAILLMMILSVSVSATTVAGRVTRLNGPSVGVRVTVIDGMANARSAKVSPFGYYRFDDLDPNVAYFVYVRGNKLSIPMFEWFPWGYWIEGEDNLEANFDYWVYDDPFTTPSKENTP